MADGSSAPSATLAQAKREAISSMKMRLIVWIWNRTLTCKEVTRLASQSLDKPLTLRQRLQMQVHSLVCVWCERYVKQLTFIHQTAPRYAEDIDAVALQSLSDDAKRRMKQALQNKGGG